MEIEQNLIQTKWREKIFQEDDRCHLLLLCFSIANCVFAARIHIHIGIWSSQSFTWKKCTLTTAKLNVHLMRLLIGALFSLCFQAPLANPFKISGGKTEHPKYKSFVLHRSKGETRGFFLPSKNTGISNHIRLFFKTAKQTTFFEDIVSSAILGR